MSPSPGRMGRVLNMLILSIRQTHLISIISSGTCLPEFLISFPGISYEELENQGPRPKEHGNLCVCHQHEDKALSREKGKRNEGEGKERDCPSLVGEVGEGDGGQKPFTLILRNSRLSSWSSWVGPILRVLCWRPSASPALAYWEPQEATQLQ